MEPLILPKTIANSKITIYFSRPNRLESSGKTFKISTSAAASIPLKTPWIAPQISNINTGCSHVICVNDKYVPNKVPSIIVPPYT